MKRINTQRTKKMLKWTPLNDLLANGNDFVVKM